MNKPCLDCGQLTSKGSRCFRCTASHEARRNANPYRKAMYGGSWRARSKAERAGRVCAVCGTDQDLTLDHRIAGSLAGGTDVLCRSHNSSKGGPARV